MLNGDGSWWGNVTRNSSLLVLSILFLPADTLLAITAWFFGKYPLFTSQSKHKMPHSDPATGRRNVLVTGVGMTKGLVLARSFYLAGHNVIGADFEDNGTVCGRVSKSISKFYTIPRPRQETGSSAYTQSLLSIVLHERIDIWVSCSGVASAVEDGEAKEAIEANTPCKAVQFDAATTQMLHEKDTFISHVHIAGLKIPETHRVESTQATETILAGGNGTKQFIMKPIGLDDSRRGDMTLLPKFSISETHSHLDKLEISPARPWILQQFIQGSEYCTHSLVINGQVKVFVACPSSELLMHYMALPFNSPISQAMLNFTEKIAQSNGPDFTGHLSFDFIVEDDSASDKTRDAVVNIYPIECNPRAHTALVLFTDTPEMANAYLELLDSQPRSKLEEKATPIFPKRPRKYYWMGHDIVTLFLYPLYLLLFGGSGTSSGPSASSDLKTFLIHLTMWHDGTFVWWDPWPWWWLYHVYWPMQFLTSIFTCKPWSRLNVSTTKVFYC